MASSLSSLTPPPGAYPGIAMDVYHRWDAASNSRLSRMLPTPAHLHAYLAGPEKEDTTALRIGRATHTAVLEPDLWPSLYTVADQCDAVKKDGIRCVNAGINYHVERGWLCGVHGKGLEAGYANVRTVLSPSDYAACLGVRDAVHAKASAHRLLIGPGEIEYSLLWQDGQTGTACKARLDRLAREELNTVVDVKTTTDASARAFTRTIFERGYHRQGAWYLDGAAANSIPVEHYVLIACEKEPPYGVAVYRLTEGALEAGRAHVRALLERYADCVARNVWPAYPDDVQDISLPDWAWKQTDDNIIEVSHMEAAA